MDGDRSLDGADCEVAVFIPAIEASVKKKRWPVELIDARDVVEAMK